MTEFYVSLKDERSSTNGIFKVKSLNELSMKILKTFYIATDDAEIEIEGFEPLTIGAIRKNYGSYFSPYKKI